eukprot:COSAG01_NODE_11484_length_1924_cov_25.175342_1_plen_191_part_00
MVDCTTNSYAHHRPIPPWTARTGRRDIARGRQYSRLGRGPGGATDHHAARPTRGPHHCREVPRKGDTTATFSLQLKRAKWAENHGFVSCMEFSKKAARCVAAAGPGLGGCLLLAQSLSLAACHCLRRQLLPLLRPQVAPLCACCRAQRTEHSAPHRGTFTRLAGPSCLRSHHHNALPRHPAFADAALAAR